MSVFSGRDCTELSEVEVAGVVAEDANVEDDFLRDSVPLVLLPFTCPLPLVTACFPLLPDLSDLIASLDFRRKLLRKEGITAGGLRTRT